MTQAGNVEKKLRELGLELPPVPAPMAAYVPAKRVGNLVYVSGQGPMRAGKPVCIGQVGGEVSLAEGYEAARLAALNCLAAAKSVLGSLDQVAEVVQVRGFVSSAPGFHDQPKVVNGASELLVAVFGDRGNHVRAALGTSSLPFNIPVEIEMIFAVAP